MTMLQSFPGFERFIPFALFALYMITACRLCRYSSWVVAGAPNPFLPRQIRAAVTRSEILHLMEAEVRAVRSRTLA